MKLFGIHYSPWTLQARWALDHHQLEYDYVEYVPMLGTPALRLASKNFRTVASVPTLVVDDSVYADSWMIARYADKMGHGERLFSSDTSKIRAWNEVAETLKHWGRVHATRVVEKDREALLESLPGFIPGPLRGISLPIAVAGTRYLTRKYGYADATLVDARDNMRKALKTIHDGLSGDFLEDEFSYADICVATSLGFIKPPHDSTLGPSSRRAFTVDELVEDFGALLAWRDAIFARRPGS